MLKRVMRILVIVCSVFVLVACSTTKKQHYWEKEAANAQQKGAYSMGLGDEGEFDVVESYNFSEDDVVSGQKVYFGYDQYTVETTYQPIITANVKYLTGHPNATVRLEGHTDEVGSREYNIALGEHRANAVRDALIAKGVARNQISTVSYGKEYPVTACVDSHKKRCQLNRRTVIIYTELG